MAKRFEKAALRGHRATVSAPRSEWISYRVDKGQAKIADEVPVAELLASTRGDGQMAMFYYSAPTPEEIAELASAWELHPLLVEDLLHAGQRPKLERYGDVLFTVVRSAHYVDEREEVDFAEFHVLSRPGAIAILCQDGTWIDGTSGIDFITRAHESGSAHSLLRDGRLLSHGPEGVIYHVIDTIVDGYASVLQGIAIDKEQIERQVFTGERSVTERIYRLNLEVVELQQATTALAEVVDSLRAGSAKYAVPNALQAYLQDVSDHLARANTRVAEFRSAFSQILDVNATLVAQRQNEDMKKISGWAAILFAPALIAAIYGMNFQGMPELNWSFGYPYALLLMVVCTIGLYFVFKWRKWM